MSSEMVGLPLFHSLQRCRAQPNMYNITRLCGAFLIPKFEVLMRIVPNGRQIDAHLLGDSVKFDNTKEGFSAALKWAADAIGALLFILALILAMSAMEAMS